MSYTAKNKQDAQALVEQYTNDYLDRYIQDSAIKKLTDAMDDNDTAIEIADSVYDYLYDGFSDNIVISTAIKQCMPRDVLLVLRQELINLLK